MNKEVQIWLLDANVVNDSDSPAPRGWDGAMSLVIKRLPGETWEFTLMESIYVREKAFVRGRVTAEMICRGYEATFSAYNDLVISLP